LNSKLKKFLKNLKLNEESISMVLGALVIVIVGILVVNYFKDRKGETLPTAVNTENTVARAEAGKNHTVVKGETLWSIAEDAYGSGYNWTDIYSTNKLTNQNVNVGQVLDIPQVAAKKPTSTEKISTIAPVATIAPVTATVAPTATSAAGNATYTVVKGDSLWKIAVKEYGSGYKWTEIARANKLVNPNIIHAGNTLTLPR
jgi:nucleoid-associated protein YgaU